MWWVAVALMVLVTEATAGCWGGGDGAPSATDEPGSRAESSFRNLGKREASAHEVRPWTWQGGEGGEKR